MVATSPTTTSGPASASTVHTDYQTLLSREPSEWKVEDVSNWVLGLVHLFDDDEARREVSSKLASEEVDGRVLLELEMVSLVIDCEHARCHCHEVGVLPPFPLSLGLSRRIFGKAQELA